MRFFLHSILIICIGGIFFFVNSCKKDDDKTITIQGIITDANQKIPISNAEVTFWASRLQNGTYNPNYIALATTFTDANGAYNLQITKDKDAGFRITVDKVKYFTQITDISVEKLPSGTHNLNYSIYPEAYIKLNVKNYYPFDNYDQISYWFYNPQPSGLNCCNNTQIIFTGQSYENTVKCRTYGAQNVIVNWKVKKNNVITPYDTSIYCIPFDTTVFNLNY